MSSTTITDTTSAPVEPRKSEATTGERVFGGASHTVLIIWSIIVILPLLWTLITSFKTTREIFASPFDLPQQWNFTNYVNAWTIAGIGSYFFNTVIVVSSALIMSLSSSLFSARMVTICTSPGVRICF